MEKTNMRFNMRPVLVACLVMALLLGCVGVAYAADVGGIRETIQVWINGRPVDAQVVEFNDLGDGSYEYVIETELEEGEEQVDVLITSDLDQDGVCPLTPEEAEAMGCQVEEKEDGTVWFHHDGQSVEITQLVACGGGAVTVEDEEGAVREFLVERSGEGSYTISLIRPDDDLPQD